MSCQRCWTRPQQECFRGFLFFPRPVSSVSLLWCQTRPLTPRSISQSLFFLLWQLVTCVHLIPSPPPRLSLYFTFPPHFPGLCTRVRSSLSKQKERADDLHALAFDWLPQIKIHPLCSCSSSSIPLVVWIRSSCSLSPSGCPHAELHAQMSPLRYSACDQTPLELLMRSCCQDLQEEGDNCCLCFTQSRARFLCCGGGLEPGRISEPDMPAVPRTRFGNKTLLLLLK